LRGYLAAIAIFCNEVKGKSALALSRDLAVSYKSAFVLAHKLREAMAEAVLWCKFPIRTDGWRFNGLAIPPLPSSGLVSLPSYVVLFESCSASFAENYKQHRPLPKPGYL
jgi:hypothetical protein